MSDLVLESHSGRSPEWEESVPVELQERNQWVCWRYVQRDEAKKPTKVPFRTRPKFWEASSTDPKTWGTFKEAVSALNNPTLRFDGIGFVLAPDDGIAGADFDDCIDEEGNIDPLVMNYIERLDSFTQKSPSGKGIRVFCYAVHPGEGMKKGDCEMYDRGRFLTITRDHLPGTPRSLEHRQEAFNAVHAEIFKKEEKKPGPARPYVPSDLNDTDLLNKIRNSKQGALFDQLWNGQWEAGYSSQSEADLALCNILAFFCGPDTAKINDFFCQSGLYREKWDRRHFGDGRTYGQATIEKALSGKTEFYTPPFKERFADARNGFRPSSNGHHRSTGGGNDPQPSGEDDEKPGNDEAESAADRRSVSWPKPMDEHAFHGLVGEIVNAILPHTESDPAALVVQLLVGCGNVIGRTAHFRAEADLHYLNGFAVMVGVSSKGRKGTSFGNIRKPLGTLDPDWEGKRILSGLSSGEGLIWNIRDPIVKTEPIKDKSRKITGYETVVVDPGEEDKRLLAYEPEFASVLKVCSRDGNTLSALIRLAWDCGNLRTLTKNSPAVATGAHVSIIGHITKDELLRYLNTTEATNGLGNRFLWCCVKRSKLLPDGGKIHEVDFGPINRRLREALEFAQRTGEILKSEETREMWHEIYGSLSEGHPGLFGSVTARAEPYVLRLACIYALLDLSSVILPEHLMAALAVWKYCEDSARFIFGDSLGDPVADEILRALRSNPQGMTRTEIRDLFGRHKGSEQIGQALSLLLEHGLVDRREEKTEGRSAERWFAL
jgi:hypothetical protein